MTIRILLADDHVVLRQGLRALLEDEPDLEVVGEADNGHQAIDLVARHCPDVILMDLVMPELDGISATQIIHDEHPHVSVVILSSLDEEAAVVATVRAGAIGYLQKNAPLEVLLHTIRAAALGQVEFSPAAAARLAREVRGPSDQPERLTRRELQVLEFVARGLANKEIAWKLAISEKTVKSHVSTILGKFGLESRTQAAMYATRIGLVSMCPVETGAPLGPRGGAFVSFDGQPMSEAASPGLSASIKGPAIQAGRLPQQHDEDLDQRNPRKPDRRAMEARTVHCRRRRGEIGRRAS